jgi:hypothetical protein
VSTPETPERPHGNRRRLTAVSVATAVVLAGGGGAYWASNATEPAGGAAPASDGGTNPPPLTLDSPGLSEAGDGTERGIAPGEPNPNGTIYEAEGELPAGPDSAAVHRPDGEVTRSEVAALAEALDLPGRPTEDDGRWRVGGPRDGSGPLLTVDDGRGGASWAYVRYRPAGDDLCGKPKDGGASTLRAPCHDGPAGNGVAGGDRDTAADPVSAEEAKQAVRPALAALHLEKAELDASATYDALRVVNAQPHAEGLPVQDWVSSFTVDSSGRLVRGHGHLGDLVKGAEYPVMTADETLKALNKHREGRAGAPPCDTGPPVEPKTGDARIGGYPEGDDVVTCSAPDSSGADENTARVTDATFGLAAEYAKGEPVLVPAWLFEVRGQGAEDTYQVTFPAIESRFLRTPGDGGSGGAPDGGDAPVSPGGERRALVSYTVDGRELTVTFWGGVCHDYRATAKDRGEQVALTVQPRNAEPKKPCIMIAKKQQVTVQLDEPLGGREVVEAQSGEELPRRK